MLAIESLAAAAESAPSVRFAVTDPKGGDDILGVITAEISETHVRFLAGDGLCWAIAKAGLRTILPSEGAAL